MNVGDKPPWPRGKCCWWTCDSNYEPRGSVKPFGKDYKSQRVYKNVKVEEIMIVRHLDGKPHMWKTWKVYNQYKGKTLLWLFQNTYRTRVAAALKVRVVPLIALSQEMACFVGPFVCLFCARVGAWVRGCVGALVRRQRRTLGDFAWGQSASLNFCGTLNSTCCIMPILSLTSYCATGH